MLSRMQVLAFDFYGLNEVQVALLISGAALIYGIRRWRRNVVAKGRPTLSSVSAAGSSGNPLNTREVTTEVHALLADLEETSRRLTAQLDNRYTRLEQLLAEADEKIRRLEQLTEAAGQAATASTEARSPATQVPEPVVTDAQRTLARLRSERGAPPAEQDPAYQPIYTLADLGRTSREIAQQLGRQPGEIELILALRQRV
jgi:hypothetical protein